MAVDFTIKQGDKKPSLRVTLLAPDGSAQPLGTGTVKFNMKQKDGDTVGNVVIDHGNVNIVDAPTGVVEYQWQTGDTDNPGDFEFEFEVDFGGGQIETYPNTGNKKLRIVPQIA